MNKKLVFLGVALTALCIGGYFWLHADSAKNPVPAKQLAAINNSLSTSAGQSKLPPAATPQKQPAQPQASVPIQAGIAGGPTENTEPTKKPSKDSTISELSPQELAKIRQELKQAVETKFNQSLGFPMDEPKMIAYAQASLKVRKINDKWDVQIAGADSDQTAIEYNNQSVEEITKALKNMQGLTIEQYNEITKLTARNAEFASIYQVYKQMIDAGAIQVPAATTAPVAPVATGSAPVQQQVPAAVTAKPVAVQAAPGTVPAPQGSPAPQYSQQPSR
jgi:hypothetical protein